MNATYKGSNHFIETKPEWLEQNEEISEVSRIESDCFKYELNEDDLEGLSLDDYSMMESKQNTSETNFQNDNDLIFADTHNSYEISKIGDSNHTRFQSFEPADLSKLSDFMSENHSRLTQKINNQLMENEFFLETNLFSQSLSPQKNNITLEQHSISSHQHSTSDQSILKDINSDGKNKQFRNENLENLLNEMVHKYEELQLYAEQLKKEKIENIETLVIQNDKKMADYQLEMNEKVSKLEKSLQQFEGSKKELTLKNQDLEADLFQSQKTLSELQISQPFFQKEKDYEILSLKKELLSQKEKDLQRLQIKVSEAYIQTDYIDLEFKTKYLKLVKALDFEDQNLPLDQILNHVSGIKTQNEKIMDQMKIQQSEIEESNNEKIRNLNLEISNLKELQQVSTLAQLRLLFPELVLDFEREKNKELRKLIESHEFNYNDMKLKLEREKENIREKSHQEIDQITQILKSQCTQAYEVAVEKVKQQYNKQLQIEAEKIKYQLSKQFEFEKDSIRENENDLQNHINKIVRDNKEKGTRIDILIKQSQDENRLIDKLTKENKESKDQLNTFLAEVHNKKNYNQANRDNDIDYKNYYELEFKKRIQQKDEEHKKKLEIAKAKYLDTLKSMRNDIISSKQKSMDRLEQEWSKRKRQLDSQWRKKYNALIEERSSQIMNEEDI